MPSKELTRAACCWPRLVTRRDPASLTAVLQVRVAGRGVAGARVLAALHTPTGDRAELQLRDDGVAGTNITQQQREYFTRAHKTFQIPT